ncbi:unnamed protein product, partial [Staurois parvus]
MCRVFPRDMSSQEIRGGHGEKRRIREVMIKQPFYTMLRINPLDSTVSITSMLYCQGRTDNSWGPPGIRGSWGPCVLAQTQKKP